MCENLIHCKTLLKEIEEETNEWKNTLCSRMEKLTLQKWSYSLKQFADSVQSLPKIPIIFVIEIEQKNPKIWMEPQKTLKAKQP